MKIIIDRVLLHAAKLAFCIVTSLRAPRIINLETLLIIAATVNISITKHKRAIGK